MLFQLCDCDYILQKVTRITGAETFLLDAPLLVGDLQKRFACSAHASMIQGAKAHGAHEIILQGDVATRVRVHLYFSTLCTEVIIIFRSDSGISSTCIGFELLILTSGLKLLWDTVY